MGDILLHKFLFEIGQDFSEVFFGDLFVTNNIFEFTYPSVEERVFFLLIVTLSVTVKESGDVLLLLIFEVFLLGFLRRLVSNGGSIKGVHEFFVDFMVEGLTGFFGVVFGGLLFFGAFGFAFFELLGSEELFTGREVILIVIIGGRSSFSIDWEIELCVFGWGLGVGGLFVFGVFVFFFVFVLEGFHFFAFLLFFVEVSLPVGKGPIEWLVEARSVQNEIV